MKLETGFPQLDNKESTWCPREKLSWPCNCLPAVPQAAPGVFKSLLPQPSPFYLCLGEGRFLSVIFKLDILQMPTFADQLAAGTVPMGRHQSHPQPPALDKKELSQLSSTPHPQCWKEFQTQRDPRDDLQRKLGS